jgi:hypothetical protein
MAIPTNTFESFDSNSIKESFEDIIFNIAPADTPFMSGIGKVSVPQTLHEWSVDALADAGNNAQVEGDDYTAGSRTATVKLNNRSQISAKAVSVSGTIESVDQAGKGSELAYQLSKAGKELKKDIERAMVGVENAKATGSSGTARESASVGTWYGGNIPGTATSAGNFATNGTPSASPAGDGSTAIAGGTNRTYTEALLKAGVLKAYQLGGNPEVVMMTPAHKQLASAFTGVSTAYRDASSMSVIGAVDIYVSDFGELSFVPNRLQNANRVDILQMDTWAMGTLRPFQTKELASSGDNEKRLLLTEWTLVAHSPNANYGIFNLTA